MSDHHSKLGIPLANVGLRPLFREIHLGAKAALAVTFGSGVDLV
jgi:hypothetical protein